MSRTAGPWPAVRDSRRRSRRRGAGGTRTHALRICEYRCGARGWGVPGSVLVISSPFVSTFLWCASLFSCRCGRESRSASRSRRMRTTSAHAAVRALVPAQAVPHGAGRAARPRMGILGFLRDTESSRPLRGVIIPATDDGDGTAIRQHRSSHRPHRVGVPTENLPATGATQRPP